MRKLNSLDFLFHVKIVTFVKYVPQTRLVDLLQINFPKRIWIFISALGHSVRFEWQPERRYSSHRIKGKICLFYGQFHDLWWTKLGLEEARNRCDFFSSNLIWWCDPLSNRTCSKKRLMDFENFWSRDKVMHYYIYWLLTTSLTSFYKTIELTYPDLKKNRSRHIKAWLTAALKKRRVITFFISKIW